MKNVILTFTIFCSLQSLASVVKIPDGRFAPLYGIEKDQVDFQVKTFWMDSSPVTEKEFKKFLLVHPEWNKKNISALYADKNYLAAFSGVLDSPVVNVSWFAASAFCEEKKGRLPSTLEWEYVAAASDKLKNATKDEEFISKILDWYSRPETSDKAKKIVGVDKANLYGLHNLHGLIWEWTGDFNSVIMTSDNREDGSKLNGSFCGAGSIGSKTKEDYAAFVRYSLRSSLQAPFTLTNLGFRCAYDQK